LADLKPYQSLASYVINHYPHWFMMPCMMSLLTHRLGLFAIGLWNIYSACFRLRKSFTCWGNLLSIFFFSIWIFFSSVSQSYDAFDCKCVCIWSV